LTTLRRKHVQVKGTLLRFSFRGKSGVDHSVALEDPRLARIVQRCQTCPARRYSSTWMRSASASRSHRTT